MSSGSVLQSKVENMQFYLGGIICDTLFLGAFGYNRGFSTIGMIFLTRTSVTMSWFRHEITVYILVVILAFMTYVLAIHWYGDHFSTQYLSTGTLSATSHTHGNAVGHRKWYLPLFFDRYEYVI